MKPVPLSAWNSLASDFRNAACSGGDALNLEKLTLRAGRLLAWCLSEGYSIQGWNIHPGTRFIKKDLDQWESKHGRRCEARDYSEILMALAGPRTPSTTGQSSGGGTAVKHHSLPHLEAEMLWYMCADFLSRSYPDAFPYGAGIPKPDGEVVHKQTGEMLIRQLAETYAVAADMILSMFRSEQGDNGPKVRAMTVFNVIGDGLALKRRADRRKAFYPPKVGQAGQAYLFDGLALFERARERQLVSIHMSASEVDRIRKKIRALPDEG